MKAALFVLALSVSASGQAALQVSPLACMEGDTQGIAITTYPPSYTFRTCIHGKWESAANSLQTEGTHLVAGSDTTPMELEKLQTRIASLERRLKDLEEKIEAGKRVRVN